MEDEQLCEECKKFDEMMNGGPVSFDVFVVCDHVKNKLENYRFRSACRNDYETGLNRDERYIINKINSDRIQNGK